MGNIGFLDEQNVETLFDELQYCILGSVRAGYIDLENLQLGDGYLFVSHYKDISESLSRGAEFICGSAAGALLTAWCWSSWRIFDPE